MMLSGKENKILDLAAKLPEPEQLYYMAAARALIEAKGKEMKKIIILCTILCLNCASFQNPSEVVEPQRIQAQKAGMPMFVMVGFYTDSASGVKPCFSLYNLTNKKMKYAHIKITAFNAVGDKAEDRHSNSATKTFKFTGPLVPHDAGNPETVDQSCFEPAWYNSTVKCLRIDNIEIDYMEGKRESINGKEKLRLVQSQLLGHDRISNTVNPAECGYK